jgi:hypothetical protein
LDLLSCLIKGGIAECVHRIDFQSVVQCDSFPASADETQFYHPRGSPVRITKNVIFHICAAGQHIRVHICVRGWLGRWMLWRIFNPRLLLPLASSDWPSCDEESCTRRRRRCTALDAIIHGTNDIIYYGPATRNLLCAPRHQHSLTPKLVGAHKFNFEHRFATPSTNSHPLLAAENSRPIVQMRCQSQ